MAKREKLYYDLVIVFPMVSVTREPTFAPDRYGNTFERLDPLFAGSPGGLKARNAVSAWFQCSSFTEGGPPPPMSDVCVDFVDLADASLPDPTGGGFPGLDPVYTSRFQVRVRPFGFPGTFTVRGTLFVQRQHSIEV